MSIRKVFFLNLDVRPLMAGIELSALNRTKLFAEYLNINPIFLSLGFNNALHKHKLNTINKKRASKDLNLISIYDYFLQADSLESEKKLTSDHLSDFRLLEVAEKPSDLRLFDEKGRHFGYCRRHEDDLLLSYINYLDPKNQRVYRRETFDVRGFLIRTELIDPKNEDEQMLQDIYHRPDGTVGIIKTSTIKKNTAQLNYIQLLSKQNILLARFETEVELIEYWLADLIKKNLNAIFVVDRCNEFQECLFKAKEKSKNNIKIISVIHGGHAGGDSFSTETNHWYKNVLENKDKVDRIILLTQGQKKDIVSRYGPGNYEVIPHGYNVNTSSKPLSQRKKNKIVYLARFSPEKRHDLALEIFKKVLDKKSDAELHLYGFGNADVEKKIKDQIKELNIQSNVWIHEFDQNVDEIYQEASLSILTSSTEGFCMSVLESLSNGCPVISFNIKYGPSEMIQNGVNGYLITPFNVDEFSEKILKLLNDDPIHDEIILNAPKSVEQFDVKNISKLWGKTLEELKD